MNEFHNFTPKSLNTFFFFQGAQLNIRIDRGRSAGAHPGAVPSAGPLRDEEPQGGHSVPRRA